MPGYTRRQLKEDKFAETAQDAAEWAGEHRKLVTWTVSILIIVIVVTVGGWTWRSRQIEQANIDLSAALRTLSAPLRPAGTPAGDTPSFTSIAERGQAAAKQLQATADKYSLVPPGKVARYLLGSAQLQAGNTAAAEQAFKTASDFSDKDIAALAKMSLASIYNDSNRQADAIKIYKELSDHPTATVSKSTAQLALAEIYEKTDPQEATKIYQQVQKDDPHSQAAQVAAQKLVHPK
ncbi:MAG TPA: tetratricopeptide repeat protein [Candidatus Angelobacter sp.]|jgi:TolA-binding protein|nr:tetratricopeptide repeat protein [Candidatus Angelobacter sp.]